MHGYPALGIRLVNARPLSQRSAPNPLEAPMVHSVVLVKQVPDTANITGKVMNDDGTVNRAKLPAIFNIEDRGFFLNPSPLKRHFLNLLNNIEDRVALEMALRVKDACGGTVTALTMGPLRATEVLRECLFMGADEACLVSDRKFAGADR